jgi:hypothetical protein
VRAAAVWQPGVGYEDNLLRLAENFAVELKEFAEAVWKKKDMLASALHY